MSFLRGSAAVLAVGTLVFAGRPAAAGPLRPVAPVAPLASVVARPMARLDVVDLGRAPAATPVRIAITLRYRNKAELDQLVRLQGNRRSPFFHHFIKPAQFAAEFAPSPADYARVASALAGAGFRVAPAAQNRTIVDAIGPASAAERFFSTEIHRVGQTGHGVRYANVKTATLPASLATAVTAVAGIDNVVKFRSHRLAAEPDPLGARIDDASPDALSGPIKRGTSLYPTALAKAYHYPVQSGFGGQGHYIGIVIDSDIKNSDLTTFWKAAKITRSGTITRRLVEGYNPGVGADVGETAIDVEMSSSLAPGAGVYIYLIPSLDDQSIEDAYNLSVQDNVVDVASSSFGGCEPDDTPFADSTDAIVEQGEAQGTTYTASTGDAGGFCEDETQSGKIFYEQDIVSTPAADPHFTAVGGTTLKVNTTGARTSETTWGPGGSTGGGGGGVSGYWPLPDYQSTLAGIAVVPTVVSNPPASQPNSGFAGRNVPDISLDASNKSGSAVAVYDTPDGGWVAYGGTSVSSPCFAALIAEQNQENGGYQGFANETLYGSFESGGYGAGTEFKDVTSGSIGAGWNATTGYDQTTGIGTIMDGNI